MSILFRKRIRFGPFLALNLSKSGLSWTAHLGPWSWNTRSRRHRVDLPGPLAWQEDRRPGERGAAWPVAVALVLTAAMVAAALIGGVWLMHHADAHLH